MSEQRTEGQEPERGQGSVTLSKEQIELIGAILEPRFEKVEARFDQVIAEMRLATKEEGEKVRVEMKEEVRQQIQTQSNHFHRVLGVLGTIWLAVAGVAATLAVNKWPQPSAVAPAAPVAQVAPVAPDEPTDLSQP